MMVLQLSSLLLCLALSSVAGFLVDTNEPVVFQSSDHGFGYQVVQMDKRVIVSAPFHQITTNKSGQLYQCDPQSGNCQPIPITGTAGDAHVSLGLAVSVNHKSSQLRACGPTVQRVCGKNIYRNGRCYQLNNRFQVQKTLPHELPECNVFNLDIVMVIDGSGSINTRDFRLMLNFVSTVMEAFKDKDTRFALMQYSHLFQTHFDFNQFASSRNPRDLVETVRQLGGQTRTSSAILKALNELFTPQAGSRDGTRRLLIVITDGKTVGETPRYREAIGLAERMGVLRFVIGVGNAFNDPSAYQELVAIASLPTNEHIMRVDDFSALTKLQGDLESKIFTDTQPQSAHSVQTEMAQQGFSVILTPEGSFLGAVGAYDWSGGALFSRMDGNQTWINMTRDEQTDMKDSYRGYALLQMDDDVIAIGVPRSQSTGSVLILHRDKLTLQWNRSATVMGDQIGSHFGAALGMVQLKSMHGKTYLLVGAPTFHSQNVPGGRVHVCLLTNMGAGQHVTLSCSDTIHGDTTRGFGHFGSAISVLPDLTGDQLPDLAVGAPCEDENQGALYIFAGHPDGFRSSYIQRVSGRQVAHGLMLFGRSISGDLDMTNDGLPDLAVGSEGKVFLLRTRPVLWRLVSMTFEPSEIPLSVYECRYPRAIDQELGFELCMATSEEHSQNKGVFSTQVTYTLTLDSGHSPIRAQFKGAGQLLEDTLKLENGSVCKFYIYQIPECIRDSLHPLRVELTISKSRATALSEISTSSHVSQVPFQKKCGGDGLC